MSDHPGQKSISIGRGTLDDSDELLPYRVSVDGLAFSLLVLGTWQRAEGDPPVVAAGFPVTCLVFCILVTRVVATAGSISPGESDLQAGPAGRPGEALRSPARQGTGLPCGR